MVHQWQQHHGKPGRRGYHNKQWAAKMNSVGLVPTHTGGLAYSCLMYKNALGPPWPPPAWESRGRARETQEHPEIVRFYLR